MQLYADLRLLTARPGPEELAAAPHHLFGIADAACAWSTGAWLRAAGGLVNDLVAQGRACILVGGTGLYFQALTGGLAEIPPIAAEIRAEASRDYEALGEEAFRARLGRVDPASALRIYPKDRLRLSRAWEVFLQTGRSISDWQAHTPTPELPAPVTRIALEPPREVLYARCDRRLVEMCDLGVLEEVAALAARGLDPALPLMKAVGFREFAAHLRGELSLSRALELAQMETRRYAKRQLTWLRRQMGDWPRLTGEDAETQWGQFLALNAP